MSDGYDALAKLFADRNNPDQISFLLGTVKSTSPLIIQPDAINFNLDSNDLVLPYNMTEHDEAINATCNITVSIDGASKNLQISNQQITLHYDGLQIGDRVAMLPTADDKKYLILEKVV